MASAPSASRPITSKSRGICKYYTTDRGCFNGRTCKFLHGQDTHTSYDRAKTCRFYASGFCKHGAQCWFSHVKGKEKEAIEEEDDLCSICFDKPATYGLLTGCSHIFCITCIKQWRDNANKSVDVVESGNTKRCPMCRQPAKFIIPSSKFYAQGQDAKDAALARYMDSMKRVPCKYFQKSLSRPSSTPFCPFGKDCFYQHRNPDGTDHIIEQGIDACMRLYASQRESALGGTFPHRSDLIRSLQNVFTETARRGLNPRFPDGSSSADETVVMRRLEILADQMLASLAVRGDPSESEGETDEEDESMPPLERINDGSTWHWPLPSMFDSDSDTDTTEMPALASVSNSSDSDQSDEEDESDSGAEEPEDHPNGRMTNIRPFDLVFEPGTEHPDAVMFERLSRLSSLWREAAVQDAEIPVAESSTRAANTVEDPAMPEDEEEVGDESEMPPLLEPPFVTDGRGRVVWSSSSDSPTPRASPSGPSTPAAPVPVEKPPSPRQAVGEGGFTTDGRGRVIGTTGVRENENENEEDDEAEESSSDSEAPAQSRSFLGRVLGAFF